MKAFVLFACILLAGAVAPEWEVSDFVQPNEFMKVQFEFTKVGAPLPNLAVATAINPWLRITLRSSVGTVMNGPHWISIGFMSTNEGTRNGLNPSMFNVDAIVALYNMTTQECQVIDAYLYNKLPVADSEMSGTPACHDNIYVESCTQQGREHVFTFYRRANTLDRCDTAFQPGNNYMQFAYGPQVLPYINSKWSHRGNHSDYLLPIVPYGTAIFIDSQNATGGYVTQTSGPSPIGNGPVATPANPWIYFEASWNATATPKGVHWLSYSLLAPRTRNATMNGADAFAFLFHPVQGCQAVDMYLVKRGPPVRDVDHNAACSEDVFLAKCVSDGETISMGAWRQAQTNDTACDFEITNSAELQWAFGPIVPGDHWFTKPWFHGNNYSKKDLIAYKFV